MGKQYKTIVQLVYCKVYVDYDERHSQLSNAPILLLFIYNLIKEYSKKTEQ